MNTLDQILDERAAREARGRRFVAGVVSVTLHGLLVAAAVFGPRLFAQPQEKPEYLPVTLLPPPAKGVPNPAPTRAPTPKPAPPKPEPEPVKAPEPTPLPSPEQPPPPTPKPQPATPSPRSPEPAPVTQPQPQAQPHEAEPDPRRTGTIPGRAGVATGRADSSFTEGAAVAGLDNPDFRYAYYVDRMAAMIRAQWTRPPVGSGIEVAIHFIIDRDGKVRDVEIVSPSGSAAFDLAGRRAVESAAPLPPLPKGYAGDTLGVTLLFR